jgi:hypothetical protein
MLERPETETGQDMAAQEQQAVTSRWKRIVIDAVLLLIVVLCVAELAIRLLHR